MQFKVHVDDVKYNVSEQDDIVLVARTAQGLRELVAIVQRHLLELKMTLSVGKSCIMSKSNDLWELWDEEGIVGCLEKVVQFKYLGVQSSLSPFKSTEAMKKRAVAAARRYKAACMRVARDGPDTVDVAMATWLNIGLPAITFGCESVPFSDTCIAEINRCQLSVGRDALNLPWCAPGLGIQKLLGLKSFKETLYSAQLKFFVRLRNQEVGRWSRDALLSHIYGTWRSPYLENLEKIKFEIGMVVNPVSSKHVNIVVSEYFLRQLDQGLLELKLPAIRGVDVRQKARHINESEESKVRC